MYVEVSLVFITCSMKSGRTASDKRLGDKPGNEAMWKCPN